MSNHNAKPLILIVDDDRADTDFLLETLKPHYEVKVTGTADAEALATTDDTGHRGILVSITDGADAGYALLERLTAAAQATGVPVIVIAMGGRPEDEVRGFAAGAADVIRDPLPELVRARLGRHLAGHAAAAELTDSRAQVARWLGHAAEYNEDPGGQHVVRVGSYALRLGRAAGMEDAAAELLAAAAPLHDIGKVGIPDAVLKKPGKLDEDEWALMQRHTTIGAEIIGDADTPLARMARDVVLTHHEKWNGEGYPEGLRGNDIPLAGRIMAIVDVFDALTSRRPYKDPWPLDKAVALIKREAGTQFDPDLVRHFNGIMTEMLNVRLQFGDKGGH